MLWDIFPFTVIIYTCKKNKASHYIVSLAGMSKILTLGHNAISDKYAEEHSWLSWDACAHVCCRYAGIHAHMYAV